MLNYESINNESFTNNPGMMNSSPSNMQANVQSPYYPSEATPAIAKSMSYQMVYPEVFYKLHPYIMMICDQMDTYGSSMPTQEMVEQMTDCIYDDICRMYPDMAEYARNNEKKGNDDPAAIEVISRFPGMFRPRFRRRGLFRDLIDILLLSELFRRRRRPY